MAVLAPLAIVAACLLVAAVAAWRRPVVFRMAARNALRRKRQTLVVVAGLMVGTAIIAGSLATGDSLAASIRQGAFDGLGPTDEFVLIEGQIAFPSYVHDELAADPGVRRAAAALSPLLLTEAGVAHARAKQAEPVAAVIGFDPEKDRRFGRFRLADGSTTDGSDLAEDEVFVRSSLADKLAIGAGDTLTLRYAPILPPLLPRIAVLNGTIVAGAGACPLPGGAGPLPAIVPVPCAYPDNPAAPASFPVEVGPGAVRATVVLTWFGPQASANDLDPVLVAPSGREHVNANGTPARPDAPAFLNVTPTNGERRLEEGTWTLRVGAKAAANQPFAATVVVLHEVYDLDEVRDFTADLERQGFDPARFEELARGGEDAVRKADFRVRGVVAAEGKGDFLLGENVFLRLDAAQRLFGVPDKINLVLVSNDLDDERGVARSTEVTRALDAALARVRDAHPDEPSVREIGVRDVKAKWLAAADEAGTLFKQFLTTVGSFTVVAGVMLIVNIFVMLAEERKSELGMARAVGLTRRQLVLLFGFEGLIYAVVASLVGVLLGLGLAFGLITGFNSIIAGLNDDQLITEFPFRPAASSVAWAFASGFLLTLATVALAARKVSRLNVVRAIRRIEEPNAPATRRVVAWGSALLAAGAAGTVAGVGTGSLPLLVLAPCVGLIGLAMVLSRWFDRTRVYPLAGLVTAAYCTWTIFALPTDDALSSQLMGPARGVIIVIAVVLIVVHLPAVVRATERLLLRWRALAPSVRPGVAYPLEKKARTGLTIAMFALVILVVVAFSIFSATFTVDLSAQSGGYDVEGDSTVYVDDLRAWFAAGPAKNGTADPFRHVQRFDALRYSRAFGGEFVTIDGKKVNYQGPPLDWVYAYDEEFARHNRFELEERLPAYSDDASAYAAVLRDPSLVIVSTIYNFDEAGQPGYHAVGDRLTLHSAGGETNFTIVGFQKQVYLGGVWVHSQVLDANFQRVRGEYLFTLEAGEDAGAVAAEMEAAFQDLGMDVKSIEEEAAKQLEASRRFFTLFELFLAFGLVVGIASLGIVTARNVIERRQEIGMLRAIGYARRHVLRMFLIEILLTTTLGVIIGSAIGFLISYGVVASTDALDDLGVAYTVPWGDIGAILLLTYAATLAATFVPARAASRVPPAEAVRYIE